MRYLFIVSIVLSHFIASAQKNNLPGRIETNDGKLIDGEIFFNDNSPTPQEIKFINLESGKSHIYRPSELTSFEIDGRKYVSLVVNIDMTPPRLQKQDYLNRRNQVEDTIFLALQVKSAISLLYYLDIEYRDHFFIQNEEGEFTELIRHEYFDKVPIAGSNNYEEKLITNYMYRNQLSYSLRSCPPIVKKLEKLAFNLNEIQKLILEYNNCIGKTIDYHRPNEKIQVKFGGAAGYISQSIIFKSDENIFEGLTLMEIDPSLNPALGMSLDLIFPMNFRKWSLNNMLLFAPFKYQSSVTIPTTNVNSYENLDYLISGSYLKLLSKMRYSFSRKRIRPFINLGISAAYLSSFKNEKKSEFVSWDFVRLTESPAIEKYKSYEIGLNAGVGIKIGPKFSVEYIFEGSDGMSKYLRLKSNFRRNYLLVNYTF